jgi:hypothetical protein
MLFLSIIGRIHVRFENEAPVFYVDPRGPIRLTKDAALTTVWALTVAYSLLVALVVYIKPQFSRSAWMAAGVLALTLALVAAMAEPLWGLVVLADAFAVFAVLQKRAETTTVP